MKYLFSFTLGILLGIFLTGNIIGFFTGDMIYRELKYPHFYQSLFGLQDNSKKIAKIQAAEKENGWESITVPSPYGYKLRATFIKSPVPSDKTVIILHGLFQNRSTGLDYCDMYLERGYNVLLPDSRSLGESGGLSISWGFFEKDDVSAWVSWLKKNNAGSKIGIHGISMGAATALLHRAAHGEAENIAFYISDSAYNDFQSLIIRQVNLITGLGTNEHMPKIILFYLRAAARYEDGIDLDAISPQQAIKESSIPVLFLHGEADSLVMPQMSRDLYDAASGKKMIAFFKDSPHASGIYTNGDEYRRTVGSFLDEL
jgi:hypothetical protein